MVNKEFLLEHILKSDLTATEKRYLEKLIGSVKWISVKDRLPEDGEPILIVVNDLKSEPVQADVCYYDGDEAWLDSGYNFGSDVIYWMPLPEPPEQEGEKTE